MRYQPVLLAAIICLWTHVVYSAPSNNDLNELLENKASNSIDSDATLDNEASIVKRDVTREENQALAKMLLDELIMELQKEAAAQEAKRFSPDLNREMAKRKAFWQQIGGPLPVATRLASFGSKIEPDGSRVSSHAFKAMRYGRRR